MEEHDAFGDTVYACPSLASLNRLDLFMWTCLQNTSKFLPPVYASLLNIPSY